MVVSITRWVLAHRRFVIVSWVLITVGGIALSGAATKAMDQKFSVPGKEGWDTNVAIAKAYGGTGGNASPLVPIVTLPAGRSRGPGAPGARPAGGAGASRPARQPRGRLRLDRAAAPSSPRTGGRSSPSPIRRPTPSQPFGDNPKAEKKLRAAIAGATIAGARST